VHWCRTAQFCQTHTIMHNSQNPAKSHTILKDLLKFLIKSGILLITKIPKNFNFRLFPGYLPSKTIEKSLAFLDHLRGYENDRALFHPSAPAWALVIYFQTTSIIGFCFRVYRFLVQFNNLPGTRKKCRRSELWHRNDCHCF